MKRALTVTILAAMLAGCAADSARKQGEAMIQQGDTQEGLKALQTAVQQYPDDIKLRTTYRRQLDQLLGQLLQDAETARARGDMAAALARYQQMLSWDPGNVRAQEGMRQLERSVRSDSMLKFAGEIKEQRPDEALDIVRQVLAENPRNPQAVKLKDDIENRKAREANLRPALAQALKSPISLQFRDQPVMSVFDIVARIGKVNFIFDRDVPANLRTTIFARDTTVEDVINLILATNQLDKKILNDNTILIYPKRPDKDRDYKDLVMRTFYLSNADPKQVLSMLKQMVKTRDVYIDERLNMLVMRDTPEAISVAERLIAAQDLPQSEVVFDVEVLEVNSSDTLNLGIRYPDSVSATVGGFTGATDTSKGTFTPGQIGLDQLSSLNKGNVLVNVGSPTITANLSHAKGAGTILANPKIRVKNRDKAKILIGDRLPVVTTVNSNGVVSETVSYQDVGLTLNVEPTIGTDGDIGVKVQLEVSNVTDKQTTKTGLLVYQIGTRRAETVMSGRDGETQILAGLLSRNSQSTGNAIPGLGELPILDRIFGSKSDSSQKTELVLSITPRIVRNLPIPSSYVTQFDSGTDASISTDPLRLRNASTMTYSAQGGAVSAPPPAPAPVPVAPPPAAAPAPAAQAPADATTPVPRSGLGRR
ncbi:secretin N-terminal domain-containing protein [Jeongeupia naejangsanensis]|uniref:Secretin and TonB N-terminal domain-containing protein n=1 Tax=Jeongeupia naejangsanensis TaxID=613195 RepID=A0ABS2BMJ2_9NEIS|nr:secretin N-terminal domain-containing protein [Jeongeupia naejangsanensis]MBM3116827.1 secretin and TonB N-terminal domain-containing protein [Jeongeupia naejangsanensis]